MEGAAAQAEQQHRHSRKSYSIAAGAHIQQQQHRAMDAKASRRRRGGRTGEGEKEEHTPGRADDERGHGGTRQMHGSARPGQAIPRQAPQRPAQLDTPLVNTRASLEHRRRAAAVAAETLGATGGSRMSRRRRIRQIDADGSMRHRKTRRTRPTAMAEAAGVGRNKAATAEATTASQERRG